MTDTRHDVRQREPESAAKSASVRVSRFAWLHPRLYLSAYGIVGLALAAACTWAFFGIADAIPEKGTLVRIDVAVANWLQAHGTERGESVFVDVSYLGAPVLVVLLALGAIALVARRQWRHLAVLAIACGGGALLNRSLKLAFHRARPAVASEFRELSWSFPSGHAMDSLIVYGLAAYWLSTRFPRARTAIALATVAASDSPSAPN